MENSEALQEPDTASCTHAGSALLDPSSLLVPRRLASPPLHDVARIDQ
jgi:hypothetical protein